MLNRYSLLTTIAVLLLVPSMLFAVDKLAPNEAVFNADNTVTIPVGMSNQDGLMAADIPLSYSEGVTLKEVNFENTRVEYFDLKVAKINNEANTVVIGLVSQIWPESKQYLDAGNGTVANLVFEIDDPAVHEVTIKATEIAEPHHRLTHIYGRYTADDAPQVRVEPEFSSTTISLANTNLPSEFNLSQNYPNPFNPSTIITFGLPVPSHVSVRVYNTLGQEVTTVVDDEMAAGQHSVTWDGTNRSGSLVSTGVYFYRLEAEGFTETKKMMLLK